MTADPKPGRATSGRLARRRRALIALGLAGVLTWAEVSFMADTAETTAAVSIVPGSAPDGSAADVVPLDGDGVTVTSGTAHLPAGIKFVRIDVALTYQDRIRLNMAWTNPSELARATGSKAWKLRVGLYYPVHRSFCSHTEGKDGGLNVTLSSDENWGQGATTLCVFRDEAAIGPGVVTDDDENLGTQLLVIDNQSATLRPQSVVSAPVETCGISGSVPCTPAGLGANRRTYFLLGTLLNPGGGPPKGHQDELATVNMYVRATKIGA